LEPPSDERRIVFVSLIGAYQTWQQCSPNTLYSSIFLLPLKKKWIYDPTKHTLEIETHFLIKHLSTNQFPQQLLDFIEILKFKDKQGLAFWMLDEYEPISMEKESLIKPFWYSLSAKLCDLSCPISGKKYNPLQLNAEWWRDETCFNHLTSKYDTAYTDILFEFYSLQMIFKSIQEIIYQSNPHSLCPVVRYGENGPVYVPVYPLNLQCDKKGEWWVAEDLLVEVAEDYDSNETNDTL